MAPQIVPVAIGHILWYDEFPSLITVDHLSKLEYIQDVPTPQSSYTSKCQDVCGLDGWEDFHKELQSIVSKFVGQLHPHLVNSNFEVPIVSSWANKTPPNASIPRHFHTMSLYSGVFYPYEQKESTPLILYTPLVPSPLNAAENVMTLKAAPGTLYVFPSSYFHEVRVNESDEDRYSVAFNVFMSGDYSVPSASISVRSGPVTAKL